MVIILAESNEFEKKGVQRYMVMNLILLPIRPVFLVKSCYYSLFFPVIVSKTLFEYQLQNYQRDGSVNCPFKRMKKGER